MMLGRRVRLRWATVLAGGLLASVAGRLSARDLLVEGRDQLAAALAGARPGDIVTLKDGEWRDAKLVVDHGGEAGQWVEIRAQSPGGVKLTGASRLEVNAPYVAVDGLWFHGGAINKGAVIEFNSHHGIVRHTAITDYNPVSFETAYYWVFFAGDHNQIDRCYFKGKNHLQPVIGNAIGDSRHNTVSRSYFKNIPYVAGANGREIIRVWGSGKLEERDDDGAYFTIEHNLFERADGEGTEIISLKSNHNVVRLNTVVATRGGINIRRGNFNKVEGNILLGEGADGAQGLRMSGRDNVVTGNFISHCGYGIRIACGEFIAAALTPSYVPDVKPNARRTADVRIPTYPQVQNLKLSGNVTVGIAGPDLEVGSSYKNHWPESQQVLLPEGCVIENNRFVRPKGGAAVVVAIAETNAPLDRFSFKPNSYRANRLIGSGTVAEVAQSGFATVALPAGWSEANERSAFKPLTAADVGPEWVLILRRAGQLSVEDMASAERTEAPPARKNKRKR
jgi:poly(beta-D-mannuronate) lyase